MEYKSLADKPRIEVVDALRGFALLGIIVANIPFAYQLEAIQSDRLWVIGSSDIDSLLKILVRVFIENKFIAIFSILFGFGFYIQLNKAREQGVSFRLYFLKRMLLLLAIGCIHGYLLWFGDIIRDYAICGMLLLFFINWSEKKLLYAGIVLSVFFTGSIFILNGIFEMSTSYPYDPAIIGELEYSNSYFKYLQINFTIDPFVNFIHDSPITLSFALGCMLIGFWLGKIDFFKNPEKHKQLMKRWIWTGCTVGIASSILYWMIMSGKLDLDLPIIWLVFLVVAGMVLQSLAYISLFVKLYSNTRVKKALKVFVPIGRMSLTNYISQTIFFTLIFFHWFPGLRFFGKLTLIETSLIAIVIFAIQTLLSNYWLKTYSQGPLEYIWKRLSYN